ncbi:MAG: glycosyltransferase family 25 protein, partial [Acidobacteriota bacterium]
MDVTLINLDRSSERLAAFHRMNGHLQSVTRVAASDGARYPRPMLIEKKILAGPMPEYTNGAIGCALSHLGQWEQAVRDQKVATVAEDDAIFHRDFDMLAPAVLANLPADWDILLWGWNFDSILLFDLAPGVPCLGNFDQAALRASLGGWQQSAMASAPRPFRLMRAFGTVCYSVSPAGAERLYNHCVPIRPMDTFYPGLNRTLSNTGIDRMMNEAYPSLQSWVC